MSKIENYKTAIDTAKNAVENLDDSQLKIAAFQTILNHLLSTNTTTLGEKVVQKSVDPKKSIHPFEMKTSQVYGRGGYSPNAELDEKVFHITPDGFRVIADLGANLGKPKQVQYVLLHLYGNYILTKRTLCPSKDVLEGMRKVGFKELPNLNVNLRSIPTLVIVTTKRNKNENTYEITQNGIKVAQELMHEISANQGVMSEEPNSFLKRKDVRKKTSPLSRDLLKLISESFFEAPKTVNEIKEELDERGSFYERGIIDEKIRRGFLGKKLRRIRQSNVWAYLSK